MKLQRKEAKKAKKKKKALALASKEEEQEQVSQMVTIKRVLEPNSAEPTVTITLRGATPNEDKVLYTLLNGQGKEVFLITGYCNINLLFLITKARRNL